MNPILKTLSSIYSCTDALANHVSNGKYKASCFLFPNVIDRELANAAVDSLEKNFYNYGSNSNDKRRKWFYAVNDSGYGRLYHQVNFDKDHVPEHVGAETNWSEAAQKVVNISLTRFGKELQLVGAHEVGIAFVETTISMKGTGNFVWHTNKEASWTMRTLLSNPDDAETGWIGGEFSRSTYYLQSQPIGIVQPEESIKVHSPVFGGSILYYNINAINQDGEMKPRKDDKPTRRVELEINLKDKEDHGFFNTPYIKFGQEVPMKVNFFGPGSKI